MASTDIAGPRNAAGSGATTPDEAQLRHNQEVVAMLKSWEDGDPEDQRETLEALLPALDQHRFSLDGRTFPA